MGEPRELFETELAEIREELLRLGVRPRERPQQSAAILEDWQHAVHHWLYRMQSEMALWGEPSWQRPDPLRRPSMRTLNV
jgi:hypothetical protein